MVEGKFIFSELMDHVPWRRLQTCVNRYNGDYKIQTYRFAEQFRVMAFAQLTYRHSLREIETLSSAKILHSSAFRLIPSSSCNLLQSIFMMQPTKNRLGNHSLIIRKNMSRSFDCRQNGGSIGNPRSQARMRSAPVVMVFPLL